MLPKRTWLCLFVFTCCILQMNESLAQASWASWSHTVSTKGYEGHRFKVEARIKTVVSDDSAAARLWVRIDKAEGRTGFFDNMWNRPVRNTAWKTYSVEGSIDSAATQMVFGALVEMNGKFYYDDFKVVIEQSQNKWKTIYTAGFDKDMNGWQKGIGNNAPAGRDNFFKAAIQPGGVPGNNALLIEATDAPNYGSNKKAGKFAAVNGIKLYYEIYGEGAPLVILHGNGGSISSASSHYPALIKKYKVIAVDSRSQGKSTDTDQPLTYDQMAADINVLLDQLHIDSAFIWGQSDGAILCLLMAKDYPKKVKRVIAYAPNIQPDSSALFGWAVNAINRVISTSKDKHEVKLYQMMHDYPNIPYEDLQTIKAPCLIMGGDRDAIRPEHLVKMFQHIPNSQLCIWPGSTHGGAWENQEAFLKVLNDFFNKPFKMPTTEDWFKE